MTPVQMFENKAVNALSGVGAALVLLAVPCFFAVPILLFITINWYWGTFECCYSIFIYLEQNALLDMDKLKSIDGGIFADDTFRLAEVVTQMPRHLATDAGFSAALYALLLAITLCVLAWRISRAINCVDHTLMATVLGPEIVRRVKRVRAVLAILTVLCATWAATSYFTMRSFSGGYYDHTLHPIQYLEQRGLINEENFAKFEHGTYASDHLALETTLCPAPMNFVRECSGQKAVGASVIAIVLGLLTWRLSWAIGFSNKAKFAESTRG